MTTSIATARAFKGAGDLNFTKVLVNGFPATVLLQDIKHNFSSVRSVGTCGAFETAFIAGVPIIGGGPNKIEVFGTVGGTRGHADSYGGTAAFDPLPEPTTWAMMLLGFGAIGSGARRKRNNGLLRIA